MLSLEDASVADFSNTFKGYDVVYFSAGAGGKGGEERTKKVDYEGALKIFDAIEGVEGPVKPRLILVSALDVRDPEKIPAHYVSFFSHFIEDLTQIYFQNQSQNEDDIVQSNRMRKVIPAYMHWKYEADKNLVKRTAFKWTILRPGGLSNNPGEGKVEAGKTHLGNMISVRISLSLTLL